MRAKQVRDASWTIVRCAHLGWVARNLNEHIEKASERRDPSIKETAKKYNTLCTQIGNLIRREPSLRGKVAPVPIDLDTLYSTDVNEELWMECGLEDEESGDAPSWLADADVRDGIRWMLQLDRCKEEQIRIEDERCAMQEWFEEEWANTTSAKACAGTLVTSFLQDAC